MGSIVVVEHVSLDGVMQSPGRPDEDTHGGFDQGGWAFRNLADDPEAAAAAFDGTPPAALLFGRRTYLDLVGYWLAAPPNPFAAVLRDTPKHVVTSTLPDPLPHPANHRLQGDPVDGVARLRESVAGDVVVLGSGQLVRALAAAGLVDSYVLTHIPVLLGCGTRLFDGARADLDVVSSTTTPKGTVVATYAVRRPASA